MKTSISEKARVGVMSVGHREYWEWNQFPGMKENLMQIGKEIADCIAETGAEVIYEFVDNREASYEAGLRMKQKDIDLLFLHITTYAASGRWVQGALAADAPIVVVGSQHWKDTSGTRDIDADEGNSSGGPCGFPEAYHALMRCGKEPVGLIFGIHIDERFRNDLHEWTRAANAVRAFKGVAFGFMGHTYEGMLDMNFDPTSVTKLVGAHVKMVEMCELVDYVQKATNAEVAAKIEEIKKHFEFKDRSYERMTTSIMSVEGEALEVYEANYDIVQMKMNDGICWVLTLDGRYHALDQQMNCIRMVTSIICFKEPVTQRNVFGLVISIIALVVINV